MTKNLSSSGGGYFYDMWINAKYIWSQGRCSAKYLSIMIFRISLTFAALFIGFALYHRTTNMWTLKNLGDSFLTKKIGLRPIVIGAFYRPQTETNVKGHFAVNHQF